MLALFLAAPSAKSTKTTEVVLSRYDEPLDWADALHTLATVTVYDKSRSPLPGSTPLPNVGRESHTYLSHIISRYESLAEWTVFSQAAEPSFGYKGHRSGGGHLAEGVSFSDYLTPRLSGAFFINTAAFNTADFSSSLRMSYTFDDPGLASQAECPTRDGWSSWWDMGWFATYVRGKTSAQNGTSVIDFYNRYVRPEAEPVAAAVFSYPQGARFAVSAATIRRHPKAYYEALLETVSHSADPWAGYYLEWLWPVIFGRAACELPTTAIPPVTHRAAMADLERAYHAAVPADRRHLQTTPDPSPDPSPDASPVASPSPEPTSEPTPTPANPTPTPPAGESSPSPPSAPSPLPPSPPPVASSPPPSPPPVASSPPPPPSSPPPPPPLSPGEEMQHTVSFSVTVAAEADDVESMVEGMRLALADFLGLPPADIEAVVEADGRRRRASETVTVTFRIRVSGDVAAAEEVQTSLQELQGDSTAAEQALSLEAGALISMSSVELESRAVAQEAEEEPSKRELSTGVYAVIVLSSLLVTVGLMGAGVIVSRRRMAWKAVNEGDADKPEPSSTTAEDGKPEQRVLLGQQQV